MEVNSVRLEELASYGFCSLQHRLRFQHGFPWFPGSYSAAVPWVVRKSLSELFRRQMLAPNSKTADLRAYDVFKEWIQRAQAHYKPTILESGRHSTDFMLGVLQVSKVFDPKRDVLLGFDVPAIVPVQMGDRTIEVSGSVDVVYRYMADTIGEHFVLGYHTGLDDPMEDLVNYRALRYGFAVAMLRQSTAYDRKKPVRVFTLPILRGHAKHRWDFDKPKPSDVTDFDSLVAGMVKGIEAGVALPTGQPVRCEHCPFQKVCSPSLITADAATLKKARDVVEREARLNPFWSSK